MMTAIPTDLTNQSAVGIEPFVDDVALPFHQTELGKQLITGAVAGAAIGAAIPLLSVLRGALFGAGILVLWKAVREDF